MKANLLSRFTLFMMLFAFYGSKISYCQDLNYAREVIQTLSSEEMYGRGYLQQGHERAATYIEQEFRQIGLSSFKSNTFKQYFNISINTHPISPVIKLDGVFYHVGQDYVFTPASPNLKNVYEPVSCSIKAINKKKKFGKKYIHRAVFVDLEEQTLSEQGRKNIYKNELGADVVLLSGLPKLTHRMSQIQSNFCVIEFSKHISKPKTLDLDIKSSFFDSLQTQNLIGFVPGTVKPDSFMVFSAHYDHLGGIGDSCFFPGANDNASGIAMLLNLAKYYHQNPGKYTTVFIAFGAEEVGLLGSKYFVENPLFPIEKIKFLINMDMMGTGDDGIQVVNATLYEREFNMLQKINENHTYLSQVKSRGKSANSDHHWFTEKGVPAFFIYTLGGVAHYHDIYDRAETLPLTEFEDVFRLLTGFIVQLDSP